MSFNIITRAASSVLAGRRRVGAALIAATAVLLATAGSAAAYTPNPIPLNSANWSGKVCCGGGAPGWYTDAFGIVHLQGAVTQTVSTGPNAPLIGTLPTAARPNREVFTIVHTFDGTYADLAIAPTGQIGVIAPRPPAVTDLAFVSLEGITYQPSNQLAASPIEINQTNWTTSAGFGTTTPGWYKDGSGIVHLQGATKQWFAGTGGSSVPNLIGAVPPAAAPVRPVSTIVHTAFGTYADLTILTGGAIFVSPPRAPAVTDLSFLSLESVSYQAGALFNHIANVNTRNWATAFSGEDPGWVEDKAGVVHLQGAVTQTSTSGPNAYLVATLPAIIAPTRTVFTIAPTNAGTYADLAIAPDGGIRVIGPRPPAVQDLRYLWLDGITYQPTATAGPHGFMLTRRGDVLALLRKPRSLELLVFKLGPKAHLLGAIRLGNAPAGPSRHRWNLRVAGHRLQAGTYIAELAAVPERGLISGGPGVTFTVTYPTGPVRVLSSTCSVANASRNRC